MPVLASNGSFLIKPGVGLMVWTLLVFGVTMVLLAKLAFPRISEALGRRQRSIEDSIDTAERTRTEAEQILVEYRQRLQEARAQSEEIVQHARQTAEGHEREAKEGAREIAAEAARRAQREIEAATKQALGEAPPGGRRPDDHGHREGDQEDPRRLRPEASGRGGAGRTRLLGPVLGRSEQLAI